MRSDELALAAEMRHREELARRDERLALKDEKIRRLNEHIQNVEGKKAQQQKHIEKLEAANRVQLFSRDAEIMRLHNLRHRPAGLADVCQWVEQYLNPSRRKYLA